MKPHKNHQWTAEEKQKARSQVNYAVQSGRLPRPDSVPCTDCKVNSAKQYDHPRGYADALDVEAVCINCHFTRDLKGYSSPRADAVWAPEMGYALAKVEPALAPIEDKVLRVVEQFFARQSPHTVEGYKQDLLRFAEHLDLVASGASPEQRAQALVQVARHLFALSVVDANYAVLQYVTQMGKAKAAPATINRRLAALRSLVRLGQMLGAVPWTLGVRGVKSERLRDVAGPTLEQVRMMLTAARQQQPPARAARDVALLLLFFTMGLRGVEARELQLVHLDLPTGRVFIRGKGRTERTPQTLSASVQTALASWLTYRGTTPGPLFVSLSRRGSSAHGLTRKSVWSIIYRLGKRVGIHAWPHGLRHAAITESLDMLNGDVRAVRKFSRHEKVQTVMDYDDARQNVAGSIAEQLAQRLEGAGEQLTAMAHRTLTIKKRKT